MAISMAYLQTLSEAINAVSGAAQGAALAILTRLVDEGDYESPFDLVEDALRELEPLFQAVAERCASLSATSYDVLRLAATGEAMGATPYPDRDAEWTRSAMYGIAKDHQNNMGAFIQGVLGRIDYEAKRASGSTMFSNGVDDSSRPRFARVPTGSETCPFCIMLASRGFVYASERSAGKLDHYHANCVTGSARVGGRGLVAVLRRKYEGILVRVVTSGGDEFAVTPEHPILTERGWVLADHLVEGDGLVRTSLGHRHEMGVPDVNDANPTAEEVFEAARLLASALGHRMPATTEDLDAEAIADGDVEVVPADRSLGDALEPAIVEPTEHQGLTGAGGASVRPSLDTPCPLGKLGIGRDATTDGGMGGGCLSCPLLRGHLGRPDDTGVGPTSQLAAGLDEPSRNGGPADPEFLRELEHACSVLVAFDGAFGHRDSLASGLDAVTSEHPVELGLADSDGIADLVRIHPGEVEVDDVAVIERLSGSCHVYNFQTLGHWFTCEDIVTHNCDCRIVPQFGGESYEGYDPDEYYSQYQDLLKSGEISQERLAASVRRSRQRKREASR